MGTSRRASSSRLRRSHRRRRTSLRASRANRRARCAPRSAPASGASAERASARCGATRRPSRTNPFGSELPPMLDASLPSLLEQQRPSKLGHLLGKLLGLTYRALGTHRYDRLQIVSVLDFAVVVLPSVANPKLLRTGAFFASRIDADLVAADAEVLDLGTGSGVCALAAARYARRVVAVDINSAAIRC